MPLLPGVGAACHSYDKIVKQAAPPGRKPYFVLRFCSVEAGEGSVEQSRGVMVSGASGRPSLSGTPWSFRVNLPLSGNASRHRCVPLI